MSTVSQSTIFAAIIQMLQPLGLLVLMNTLPPLIRLLGMAEGFPAESRNQLATLSRYFYFQASSCGGLVLVFVVVVVSPTEPMYANSHVTPHYLIIVFRSMSLRKAWPSS